MAVLTAGIRILIERGLGDDGCTTMKKLCNEIDSLGNAICDHHTLWRDTLLQRYELLKTDRRRLWIVADSIEMSHDVLFQRRQVSMLIDVGAEINLHQVTIAVNIVTVSFYHLSSIIFNF